ncbi:hypothetical protein [uncultured Ruminococcus sp.]|uniref:hypothetical protein n=1 Tax=uncultured Ruminococcus sp. TaxID=165186 RepID=UPI002608BC48|nr:hypothetical protein [uncultured Ruminococcus sp.]
MLPAAFCLFCCLTMTGCTLGGSVDSLLKPPSLSEEQQQIYVALQNAVGSAITLQYPRAGTNLSAFTVADLDADGEDEALVFYKKTSLAAAENGLRLSILDQVEEAWMSVCDRPADGAEVERIVISPMGDNAQNQIFIGYSGVDQSDKSLTVYHYSENALEQMFTTAYTMFDVADLDSDSCQELLVLGKASDSSTSSAAVYRLQKDAIADSGKLELRAGFTDFSQVIYGMLPDGQTGIYIDGATSPSSLQTEILTMGEGTLSYVLPDADTAAQTARSVGYLSMDVDGNGTVEIPVQEPFPGYSSDSSEQVRMTRWLGVSGTSLTEQARGYFSLNDGCMFFLPLEWYGTVTAVTDALTGDIVFCCYDGEINDHMTELLRYGVAQSEEEQEERESDGYQLLHTRGKAAYYMRTAETGDALALSWQELMVQFLFLS